MGMLSLWLLWLRLFSIQGSARFPAVAKTLQKRMLHNEQSHEEYSTCSYFIGLWLFEQPSDISLSISLDWSWVNSISCLIIWHFRLLPERCTKGGGKNAVFCYSKKGTTNCIILEVGSTSTCFDDLWCRYGICEGPSQKGEGTTRRWEQGGMAKCWG